MKYSEEKVELMDEFDFSFVRDWASLKWAID